MMKQKQRSLVCFTAFICYSVSTPLFAVERKVVAGAETASAAAAIPPQQQRQARPIPMGVSISNTPSLPFIYAGTAGLLVHSMANPSQKFILTNNHVAGAIGPSLCPNTATPGTTRTLQPGTLDIGADPGNDLNFLAGLVAGFWPLSSGLNVIDAALVLTNSTLAKTTILGIGEPNPAVGIASPGRAVTKAGRTTAVTTGIVDSINSTVVVNYGTGCSSYLFIGQTIITPGSFSSAGDSGSAILDSATKTPVGLLFAGSSTFTIANQLYWVYRSFGVFPDSSDPGAISSVDQLTKIQSSLEAQMDPRITAAAQVQARHQNALLGISGIRAVGIGLDSNGEIVLKAYAVNPTAETQRALPAQLEGVRVVLQDAGSEFVAR
jgi:hypothetical protein